MTFVEGLPNPFSTSSTKLVLFLSQRALSQLTKDTLVNSALCGTVFFKFSTILAPS
ncbi:hypothetical protein [uncultured Gammaproteobacteria bacterium]|uniref:Uncharacterized protein n=1 Tax=Bathymodiolus azoricus thioautotrophic gill symbiont TaxID=235205 RepID=A0A1H6MUJ7_9GAMM|nr:hypothetical protein [uncultured Gammaproteobacteria bacterium]CAC9489670.1 hypothetical protein [uncultured Gammaproteobacteria bacterium]SEI05805.1 hypothetical protein BAZSYMA_ACONTIG53101_5 [Bathymodiolus azoricus thioautotrophic gill symbiont]